MFNLFSSKLLSIKEVIANEASATYENYLSRKRIPAELKKLMVGLRYSTFDGITSAYFGKSRVAADYTCSEANKKLKKHRAYVCCSNGNFAVVFSPKN